MAQKIDYNKTTRWNILTTEKSRDFNHYRNLRNKPTNEQLKYYNYLFELCEKHGINAPKCSSDAMTNRSDVSCAINYMLKNLSAIGVRAADTWQDKKRYRFDREGNIIDTRTGKIHKKAKDISKKEIKNEDDIGSDNA